VSHKKGVEKTMLGKKLKKPKRRNSMRKQKGSKRQGWPYPEAKKRGRKKEKNTKKYPGRWGGRL